jgi:formylglycine-generating enzyme required for sulfatase activity
MIPRALILPAAIVAAALLPSPSSLPSSTPSSMVKIPGGTFDYGTDSSEIAALVAKYELPTTDIVSSEAPRYQVTLPSFYMDKHEVTIAEYILFAVRDTTWLPKGDSGQISNGDYLKPWLAGSVRTATDTLPVTYVTWFAARKYCKQQGKRLPTEVEWEYAARGGAVGDVYPWGDAPPDTSRANYGASAIDHPVKVGHYAPNAYGLYDMAGNVWEFTADQWSDPREAPGKKPVDVEPWSKDRSQAARQRVVIKGGSYGGGPVNLRVRYRDSHPAGGAQPFVGFRCAKND